MPMRFNSPRWLVYIVDVLITLCSVILAYLLRFNFKIPAHQIETLYYVIPTVVGVRMLLFFIGKTYAGIVQYTSIKDAQRIIITNLIGSALFFVINFISYYLINKRYIVPTSIIILEYIITVSAMTALRLIVKMLAAEFNFPSKEKSNVYIIGINEQAVLTKKSLEYDRRNNYKVIGFIDIRNRRANKKIEGISIYNYRDFKELMEKNDVSTIIFADKRLNKKIINDITDICLEYDTDILTVPELNSWINGELSARQIKSVRIEDLLGREPIQLDRKRIHDQIDGKIIMVTGGAGSIGSEIARQITTFQPKLVVLLDQAESALYDVELELSEKREISNFEVVIADITDKVRMKKAFNYFKPDIIYHAAAYKHVPLMEKNPAEAIRNNVLGSQIIADMAIEFNIETFVFVSTDKAVNPTNIMGASKRLAEIYIQTLNKKSQTQFVTTRFGNVLGSNGSVIPRFKKQIETGGPVTVTHPEVTRFFMTIPEACQLVIEAGAMGKGGEIYLFDMGESIKIADLAKKMIKLSGLKLGKDIQLKFTGLRPGEKLYEELLNTKENTTETHHPQIMIAKVQNYDYDWVKNKFTEFDAPLKAQDNTTLVKIMKEILPEFKSQNSVYEKLDK